MNCIAGIVWQGWIVIEHLAWIVLLGLLDYCRLEIVEHSAHLGWIALHGLLDCWRLQLVAHFTWRNVCYNEDCRSTLGMEEAGNFLPLTRSSGCHSTEQLYIHYHGRPLHSSPQYRITEKITTNVQTQIVEFS